MVEAAQQQSVKQQKLEQRTQVTPESEKPRVQLMMKKQQNNGQVSAQINMQSQDAENLDLLKKTVASLANNQDGGDQSTENG